MQSAVLRPPGPHRADHQSSRIVTLRMPKVGDAKEMARLVRESGILDVNSDYAYLLLCLHFRETCIVAEADGSAAGFTAAYCLPQEPETLFVWQIAVAAEAQGQGLASRMLDELVRRGSASDIRFVQATVTPSNEASRTLFRSLARRHDVACEVTPMFTAEMFSQADEHEPEDLFRVGPFRGPDTSTATS